MQPVISIVGKSKSGKTTIICGLISALKNRGLQVASIKHDVHGFDIDKPGKDSWKHGEAGADTVVISSPAKMAMIEQLEQERSIDELLNKIDPSTDIVLTEGYKSGSKPKIEVVSGEETPLPLCDVDDKVLAFACQYPDSVKEQLDPELKECVRFYSWNDYQGIAEFIYNKFIGG